MTQHGILSTRHLLLATLLAFCSEVVLWTNPPARSAFDWLLLALGYGALAGLLLELAERFRARDAFGVLLLAGIYGMLNGLLLNPHSALIDTPRTLITRAMGAHGLAGLFALALFFALFGALRGRRGLLPAIVALLIGVGWGAWARWSPFVFEAQAQTAPETLLLYTTAGAALVGLALLAVRRQPPPISYRLSPRGWAFTLLVLIGLALVHGLRGEIDSFSLVALVTLSAFSIIILWFHQRKKGGTLLDALAAGKPGFTALLLVLVAFAAGGAFGYSLPRGTGNDDPIALIVALFTAYGLIWLPAVSLVLGSRAFSRLSRGMKL